ncbi:hypothetical protein RSOLAG22IIIB_07610 [Rhizoctonia solani]|uniref:pectin lyase n=1 Tax=Rhizoctonia solani TaxID=456999 RepID=A0A0K6FNY4_9AGAM|nr:hypothetical protein RSOLAG22IIIB_07610 [Rhizoctonia solani]
MLSLKSLAFVLFAANNVLAVGSPFGFASGTTGGAAVGQATPSSAAELKSWLEDNVTRNILLDRTYDFTDTEACSRFLLSMHGRLINPNLEIREQPLDQHVNHGIVLPTRSLHLMEQLIGAGPILHYKKAGTTAIRVKSNKTILGKGTSGWIKGKGLLLSGVSNVIIQNIRISDINPQYVWGGDALYIDNSSKVWVDHNYFKSVGRAFIVTGFGAAKQVTISNNYFDGQSTWSTGCDGHHYWPFIFAGNGDQVTFARNYIYYTAGRGPHIGGYSGYIITVHMFNNYLNDITGHAIDAGTGAKLLAEGNYFNNVKTPSTGNADGAAFAPTSSSMNSQCSSTLGRNCVSNTLAGSGSLTNTANSGAISAFTASVVKSASVMDPGAVPSYVLANAGLGKVN